MNEESTYPDAEIFRDGRTPIFITQKALLIMFFSILIYLLSFILEIYQMVSSPIYRSFVQLVTISYIQSILFIFFLIISFVGVILFYIGRKEFGSSHEKNAKWAFYFFISYLILFGTNYVIGSSLNYFLFEFRFSIYNFLLGMSSVISLVMSFLFVYIVFLLAKNLAGRREKDILYIFATISIILVIFSMIFTIWIIHSTNPNYEFYIFTYSVIEIMGMIAWIMAGFVYYKIWQWRKSFGYNIPIKTNKFLPRPEPFRRFIYTYYSKPLAALIIFLVIAVILGGTYSSAVAPLWTRYSERSAGPDYEYFGESEATHNAQTFSETAMEGNSLDFNININFPLLYFSAELFWTDEADQNPSTNLPDMFSLEVRIGDFTAQDSAENQHGEQGSILIEHNPTDDDIDDTAVVIVTLENAGDQTGPMGLLFGPLYVNDDSNEFELKIEYN